MHPNAAGFAQQQRATRAVCAHAANSNAYAFFNLLTGPQFFERVESLLPPHRERLFPPTETLSMFLSQALSADRSCQQAVDELAVKRLAAGLTPCSTRTGAYCKARKLLPQDMVRTLACYAGDKSVDRRPTQVALAFPPGTAGRRHHGNAAGHPCQSGCVSTIAQSETGIGFSTVPDGGVDLPGQWRRAQRRVWALQR